MFIVQGDQARLDEYNQSLKVKLDAGEGVELRGALEKHHAELSQELLELRRFLATFCNPEEVARLREDAERSRKEVATCQRTVNEKVGANQVQVLVDAIKGMRTQVAALERGIARKAEVDTASRHEVTLADLQVQLQSVLKNATSRNSVSKNPIAEGDQSPKSVSNPALSRLDSRLELAEKDEVLPSLVSPPGKERRIRF